MTLIFHFCCRSLKGVFLKFMCYLYPNVMSKVLRKKDKRKSSKNKFITSKKVSGLNGRFFEQKNNIIGRPNDISATNSSSCNNKIFEGEPRKRRVKSLKAVQTASRYKFQMKNRGLETLVETALNNNSKFESNESEVKEKDFKSNSCYYKSYSKDLKKVIERSDVVLEVLDSRDPLGSRSPQIEKLIITSGKKLVLILNKIDLIPHSNLEDWLRYLRQELPTIAFKANTQNQNTNLSQSRVAAIHVNESLQQSSCCVGAPFLMKVIGNYCRKDDIKTSITVGVVGFPNVGKSSVINSLKRSRSCCVSATAGMTKVIQEVSLDKQIKILDMPGVILAKDGSTDNLALLNAIKVEALKDLITPAEAIIERAGCSRIQQIYNLPEVASSQKLLYFLAKKIGSYKKGGIINLEGGAKRLINDYNKGIIKYHSNIPKICNTATYNYVKEWGKAFDVTISPLN